jgi:hypothetical protein
LFVDIHQPPRHPDPLPAKDNAACIDLHEYFIDVEGIAIASVFSLQSSSVQGTDFNAPEANGFATDCDASFSEKVFNIAVAEVESIIEPDGIGNHIWWESVSLVGIHPEIVSQEKLRWHYHEESTLSPETGDSLQMNVLRLLSGESRPLEVYELKCANN